MDGISVVIIDDHQLVRYALRGLLESEADIRVVGEAASGEEAVAVCRAVRPDVVLLDLHLPGMDGIEVCKRLLESHDPPRVLVLTSYDDDDEVFGALDVGASGYLMKDVSPSALIEAVRTVAEGTTVLDAGVARRVIDGRSRPMDVALADGLSTREIEVLKLMASGLSNREIASALWISESTVKSHVRNILRKLKQHDRTGAVLEAIRLGVAPSPEDRASFAPPQG